MTIKANWLHVIPATPGYFVIWPNSSTMLEVIAWEVESGAYGTDTLSTLQPNPITPIGTVEDDKAGILCPHGTVLSSGGRIFNTVREFEATAYKGHFIELHPRGENQYAVSMVGGERAEEKPPLSAASDAEALLEAQKLYECPVVFCDEPKLHH